MEPITLQQYANECSDIARELVDECNADEEQMQDRLHETIDGHQWIIYTFHNMQVLQHSKNEDAYFDDFGTLTAESFSDAMVKMAFAAFMRDVQEEIPEALERWRKEHPEAGDAGEPDPDIAFEKSQDR